MSISTEISRLQSARNTIRAKLVELGMATNTDKIDALASAIEAIVNRGAVSVTVQEGDTYTIPAGYHNGSGTVSGVSGGDNSAVGGDYSVTLNFRSGEFGELTSCQGFYIINGDLESGGEQIAFDARSICVGSNFGADYRICVYLYWGSIGIMSSGCAADYSSQKFVYDEEGNEYVVWELVITEIESDAVVDVYEG